MKLVAVAAVQVFDIVNVVRSTSTFKASDRPSIVRDDVTLTAAVFDLLLN